MISEKDRGQLLRMAGNIACGLVTDTDMESWQLDQVAELSARLAVLTMKAVDNEIAKEN